jgi:spore maturation protein CgeB
MLICNLRKDNILNFKFDFVVCWSVAGVWDVEPWGATVSVCSNIAGNIAQTCVHGIASWTSKMPQDAVFDYLINSLILIFGGAAALVM